MSAPPRVVVVTVSDRCARGEAVDASGPRLAARLAALPATIVERHCIADDPEAIAALLTDCAARADLIAFSGGTGLAPRDLTPQSVRPLLDYEVPGMAEAMRAQGARTTPHAMLSRQLVGVRGRCLILLLPGSPRAVDECLDAIWPALPHALALLDGAATDHAAAPSPALQ